MMSSSNEEERRDIKNRVIRLVTQFNYTLTVEQLYKLVKRQIPKVAAFDIIEVIYEVATNGDLPPGKYIIVPRESMRKALKIKKIKRKSAPVVEDDQLPTAVDITTYTDQFFNGSNDSAVFTEPTTYMNGTNNLNNLLKELGEEVEDEEEYVKEIEKELEVEELIDELEEIPKMEMNMEMEMEEKTTMSEEQFKQLDAQYEILINGDKIFLHPRFKKEADKLPEKIMDLFEEFGEMTPAEVVEKLNDDDSLAFDSDIRGMRIAFVVAWKQVENKLIDATTLLG